jgi:hypothetical protein
MEARTGGLAPRLGAAVRGSLLLFIIAAVLLAFGVSTLRRFGLFAESVTVEDAGGTQREFKLVQLLPKDGIPAIFDPTFISPAEANEQLAPDDLVIGVSIGGEHRAYGVAHLSSHEVVNDVVGGKPIAVTW